MSTPPSTSLVNNACIAKEKLRSIMEAASALTALGDEESANSLPQSPIPENQQKKDERAQEDDTTSDCDNDAEPTKRFIPDHKKPDAALTFPEKLMNLMRFADQQPEVSCVAWLQDGKSFVIRNPDEFTKALVPKFFKATKFSSFTRKLYRWGFRQVNRGIGPDDPIIFGNEYFQRDSAEFMVKMRSITAASTRKAEAQATVVYGVKRPLDVSLDERDQKRALLDRLIQHKAASLITSTNQGLYANFNSAGALSLSNVLRPGFGMGIHAGSSFGGNTNGLPSILSKHIDIMGQNSLQSNAGLISNFMQPNRNEGNSQNFPSANSPAEIVNAAISALRYAN